MFKAAALIVILLIIVAIATGIADIESLPELTMVTGVFSALVIWAMLDQEG